MEAVGTIGAISLALLVLFGFGMLLLVPPLMIGGTSYLIVSRLRRFGRYPQWIVGTTFLILIFILWERTRSSYRQREQSVVALITAAKPLGSVEVSPTVMHIIGPFAGESLIHKEGCMDRMFRSFDNEAAREFDKKLNQVVHRPFPARYLELDFTKKAALKFDQGYREALRGPFPLWLIDHGKRQLVDVFFVRGDGKTMIPSPLFWHWIPGPIDLNARQRYRELESFMHRTTGRCAPEDN